jgi:hypothetical protein
VIGGGALLPFAVNEVTKPAGVQDMRGQEHH